MKVSVVIPSYNHEKFIGEAIQSVLDQTFQDFEIIITDDGSIDKTVDEIKKFNDSRIKFFALENNEGFYFAFKRCLEEASGDYIAMLSSDDIFLPEKLEKQVKFLDENQNYAAVFSFAEIIDEEDNAFTNEDHFYSKIFIQENRTRYEWLRKFFYEGNCLCHPSVLIRKEFYTIDQFDPRYRQLPDFDFWIKLCMKADIYILQENLIKFRILNSEANTSGNSIVNNTRDRIEFSEILSLYCDLSILDFGKIFENHKIEEVKFIPFLVCQEAYNTNLVSHQKFALEKLYHILQNKEFIFELKQQFGFDYNSYFDFVGNSDLFQLAKDRQLQEKDQQIQEKDQQIMYLTELAESMRIKNRIKSLFGFK